jgi:hypothetical protein
LSDDVCSMPRLGLREIEEVKPAARLEDPPNLAQCAHFLVSAVEMMEHETGEGSQRCDAGRPEVQPLSWFTSETICWTIIF